MQSQETGVRSALQWCDRLLPVTALGRSAEVRLRQRLLIAYGILISVIVLPWYGWLFSTDPTIRAPRIISLVGILLITASPLWLRLFSVRAVSLFVLGVTHLLLFANFLLLGGLAGTVVPSLVIMPVLAAVLLGVRAGWVDAVLVVVATVGFDWLINAYGVPVSAPEELWPFIRLMAFVITCAILVMTISVSIELARSQAYELRWLAHHDQLTELPNRHSVYALIDRPPGRSELDVSNSIALVLVDLDHFKAVNDRFEHAVGDRVLYSAARIMQSMSARGWLVSRWGGEEFLILIPDMSLATLEDWLRQLLLAISENQTNARGDNAVRVTASAGYVFCPEQPTSREGWERLIAQSGTMLKVAKSNGRNRANGCQYAQLPTSAAQARKQAIDRPTLLPGKADNLRAVAGPFS